MSDATIEGVPAAAAGRRARAIPRLAPIDWDRMGERAAAFRDGAGDAVMLVLALAPAAAGFALLLASFGLIAL